MQCINPIPAGFTASGSLTFKKSEASREIEGFKLECRKCLPCRLNLAREKAIRVYHESKTHLDSIFLTLTYDEEHLVSPVLQYRDFQLFMKKLREHVTRDVTDPELKKELAISYMVTGEYGEKNKRPHWHAIIFNYRPKDEKKDRETSLGHEVYKSEFLRSLWGKGAIEYGSVTLESANYVARYAAKKLVHGNDEDHEYHPIHKTSSRRAIGRSWIEKHWKHTFAHGFVVLPNGSTTKIPRYYVDWLKKHRPTEWETYVTTKRLELQTAAQTKARKEELEYLSDLCNQRHERPRPIEKNKVRLTILRQKFKILQEKLKL